MSQILFSELCGYVPEGPFGSHQKTNKPIKRGRIWTNEMMQQISDESLYIIKMCSFFVIVLFCYLGVVNSSKSIH